MGIPGGVYVNSMVPRPHDQDEENDRGSLKAVDVVAELLDARIPASSANPMVEELVKGKPRIVILNKADLADPKKTDQWISL